MIGLLTAQLLNIDLMLPLVCLLHWPRRLQEKCGENVYQSVYFAHILRIAAGLREEKWHGSVEENLEFLKDVSVLDAEVLVLGSEVEGVPESSRWLKVSFRLLACHLTPLQIIQPLLRLPPPLLLILDEFPELLLALVLLVRHEEVVRDASHELEGLYHLFFYVENHDEGDEGDEEDY